MKITKRPDIVRAARSTGTSGSVGGVVIGGSPTPGQGIISSTSNTASWQPIISTITAGGTLLLGPNVAFAAGSNVTLSVTSNTATIHATAAASADIQRTFPFFE